MHTRQADPRPPGGPWDPGPQPPYEPPPGAPPPPRSRPLDLSALFVLLDGLRRAAPRELEEQVTQLIRELLLTLRSLIDWYLERLDGREQEPRVEDIPIE
jgi:hypothetical protein